MISLRSIYLSCALLALSTVPAFCTSVFYADQASWLTAVSSPSTVTFNTDAVKAYNTFTTGLVLPDNPSFTAIVDGSGGNNLQLEPGTGPYYNYGSGNSLAWTALVDGTITSSILEVTFTTPVSAISLNYMTYASGNIFDVQINNSDSTVVNTTTSATTGYPNEGFLGLTSTTSISSIYLYLPTSETATPLIDNFSYAASLAQGGQGDTGDTPELATFLLIASGLIGMALIGRRARRQSALPEGV